MNKSALAFKKLKI